MKKILIPILACMGVLPCFGQLNTLHNRYRAGDVLIKQQVEYIDPGQAGGNRFWDFSSVKTIHDEYPLSYDLPPLEDDSVYIVGNDHFYKKDISDEELIVGTEHNTMYYYRLTHDSLLQLGHENPTVRLEYTFPMTLMNFPLDYGQTIVSNYKSKGVYSSTIDMQSEGTMITSADAYGKMILPSGDTISPVLRVKTIQTIFDKSSYIDYPENKESAEGAIQQNKGIQLETCRWYSKGYRYPVFETVRSINMNDNNEIFSTAFFFSPQDHLYLDTDPDNQALLDELWKVTEGDITGITKEEGKKIAQAGIMTCRIYPNPVTSVMHLEYELKEDAEVSIDLYSIGGLLVKKLIAQQRTKGTYNEILNCSTLRPNNYVLRITANDTIHNEIIIKE